ncbi:hypothetical protein EDD16DRAFT_218907 [Pisolithus croceorrhizus]|nr:hypothetical protein EDD16DRAFT_218907 [Pisolithus croceorrhizus]KAI6158524.1 hypothetical protein EDD17DRAFT_1621808 [Pisolithus thermaeus]
MVEQARSCGLASVTLILRTFSQSKQSLWATCLAGHPACSGSAKWQSDFCKLWSKSPAPQAFKSVPVWTCLHFKFSRSRTPDEAPHGDTYIHNVCGHVCSDLYV